MELVAKSSFAPMAAVGIVSLMKGASTTRRQVEEMIVKRDADKHELEYVASAICDKYCKYPYIWDEDAMGSELGASHICRNCELARLMEGVIVDD